MSYTNAQVAELLKATNARLDRIERALVSAPTGAATVAPVAAEVVIPTERKPKAARLACSLHAEHKGGRGFSVNGMAAHRTWCEGATFDAAVLAAEDE